MLIQPFILPLISVFFAWFVFRKQEDDIPSSSHPLIHTKTTKLSNL